MPLIVTLALDRISSERFDTLRRTHFPRPRNFIAAHVTLFHKLPGDEFDRISGDISEVAQHQKGFEVATAGIQFLGRGVAIRLGSPELLAVHAALSKLWYPWLTPQDRQPFRPHVTIQNKVAPDVARQLAAELQSAQPFEAEAEGITLWRYLEGPWEHLRTLDFGL